MASVMPTGKQQYFNSAGLPLSGGRVYTYQAGTTTPKDTYSNAAGSVANSNPIILDARGEALIYWSGAYNVYVKDASDNLIYSVDNFVSDGADTLRTDLAASSGASILGFIQAGTGAVATTLQAKLRELPSTAKTDFGAAGDGTTTDTTALQNWLTANAGKFIILPPATYKTGSLSVPANTIIWAYGATLDFSSAGHIAGLTFANGGAIYGATLTGAGNSSYNASGIAIKCVGTNNSPSAPTFVNAPIVKDCTIQSWGSYGVYFSYVNGGIVDHCKITSIGYAGVGGVSCNDTIVVNNLVDGVTPGSGSGDAYGVFLDRQNGTSETADPRSYRCGIINNVIKNVAVVTGDNGQGIDTHGGVDFRIIGNTIDTCEVGIFVTSSSISGSQALGPKRCSVIGNTITGVKVGYGIQVAGAINGSTVAEYAEGIVVEGNTITGHGIAADSTSGAIRMQGTKNTTVRGNTIQRPACYGIVLNLENIGFNIDGNTIVDPHDNTYTVPGCISVQGNNNTGYIGGNTFRVDNSGLATYVAVESVRVNASLTGLDIELDRCSFTGITAGKLTYQELTSTGVNAGNMMVQRGTATVALTNASSNNVVVTFAKRMPSAPKVFLTRSGSPVPGTVAKSAIIETTSEGATGFTIVARPYDLTTFGGSGNLTVTWEATT